MVRGYAFHHPWKTPMVTGTGDPKEIPNLNAAARGVKGYAPVLEKSTTDGMSVV